jgi:hypothetical protein
MFTKEVQKIPDADIIADEVLMVHHNTNILEIRQMQVKVVHFVITNITEELKLKSMLLMNCVNWDCEKFLVAFFSKQNKHLLGITTVTSFAISFPS